jgi:hypothetical protein
LNLRLVGVLEGTDLFLSLLPSLSELLRLFHRVLLQGADLREFIHGDSKKYTDQNDLGMAI